MKNLIFTLVASLFILSLPTMVFAANATGTLSATATVCGKCVIKSTTNVAFATVDPTTAGNYDGAGTVVTLCTKGTPTFLFVAPTVAGPLQMHSAVTSDNITYGLYSDSGRTATFPSATGGAKTVHPGGQVTNNIYGRVVVATGQNDTVGAAGDYTQALTATIEW